MPASAFGTGQWVWQRNEKWLLLMHFWSCTVSLLVSLLSLYWPCLAGSASLSAVSTVRCPCLSASRSVSLVSQCEHETNQNWKATIYNFFLGSAAREPKYRCQSRLEGRVRKNSFVKEEGKSGEWGLKNSNRGRKKRRQDSKNEGRTAGRKHVETEVQASDVLSLTYPQRAGQVSACDDIHLSLFGLHCRWHSVCYQRHSLIPIMVCTHCLLPRHQSTTLLSICWWTDK